tara:strand:- start:36 stop:710 length:675 start_codon:yes stop_codon:yes gene_type:complete
MRSYRTSSNYTSNSYNAGIKSSPQKSTPSNTGNNRENYRSTQYSSQPKTSTFKQSKKKATDAVGRSNLDNLKVAKVPIGVPGSIILNAAQKFRQKTLDKNVEYFKGLKSRNPNLKYDLTDEGYKSYMKDRLDGKITASGNVNAGYGRDRDNNIQTQKVTAGGQTILTKEKTPAETKVAEEKKEYDARQTKKKGKRKNILTSSQGIIKLASDYSLSDKNLLGRVV